MSRSRVEKIKCPNCGKENDFVIWESINTQLNPELKKSFLNRDIFKFECPDCKQVTSFAYDFLYHEMEDKLMIYLAHGNEEQQKTLEMFNQGDNEMIQDVLENMTIRIVGESNDLAEKIFINDAKRDDRIIELMKVLLYVAIKNEKPDWDFDSLRYSDQDNDEGFILFSEGNPVYNIAFDTSLYESIKSKHGDKLEKEDN